MKTKKWLILIAVILTAALLTFALWDTILIYAAPKAVLSQAMTNTLLKLETRFANSPLHVISGAFDPEFKNTVELKLYSENEHLGPVAYDMTVHIQGKPQRIQADGDVTTGRGDMDLRLYMDENFAAVSSDHLVQGRYYGITYDAFSGQIRSNPVLMFLLGDEVLSGWEEKIAGLQQQMSKTMELPEFSEEDIHNALVGVLALDADVGSGTMNLYGQEQKVYTVTFSATGPKIADAARDYMDQISQSLGELVNKLKNDPESSLTATFFVKEKNVVSMTGELQLDNKTITLELQLGMDADSEDLTLSWITMEENDLKRITAAISTWNEPEQYKEKIEVLAVDNGVQDRTVLDYRWKPSDGEMVMSLTEGNRDVSLALNLQGTEEGFQISTNQFETLLGILMDENKEGNSTCTMVVSRGSAVEVPEFRDFSQWAMEDLLILLEGLGGLIGLQIG